MERPIKLLQTDPQSSKRHFQQRRIHFHPNSAYSKSLYNIALTPQMQSDIHNIPRSMSAINENSTDWKENLCGMFQKSPQHSSREAWYQKEDVENTSKNVSRSQSYQYSITTPMEIENGFSGSGSIYISVPLRNKRKRKTYGRSSGGYFFDKYMKRLYDRYVKKDDCKTLMKPPSKQLILKIKSNRQDIILADYFSAETKDAMYNLLLPGTSIQKLNISSNENHEPENKSQQIDQPNNKEICQCESVNKKCALLENQSPLEPSCPFSLRFWGDATVDKNSVSNQSYCATPNITDSKAKSCRYCDSNSETLKAMETLYLCNFKVSMEGDWLCLKEICETAESLDCFTTSTFSGSQNFSTENKCFWTSMDALENIAPRDEINTKDSVGRSSEIRNKEADASNDQLSGLNCLNTNSCLLEGELQNQIAVTDCSLCLRNGNDADNENKKEKIRSLLYQNNYLKERTRHLESTCLEIQKKSEQMEKENQLLLEKLTKFKLQVQSGKVISENDDLPLNIKATYYQNIDHKINEQNLIKQNLKLDVNTLDKENHYGLITLQEQLDNVRAINMDIYKKLQTKKCGKEIK